VIVFDLIFFKKGAEVTGIGACASGRAVWFHGLCTVVQSPENGERVLNIPGGTPPLGLPKQNRSCGPGRTRNAAFGRSPVPEVMKTLRFSKTGKTSALKRCDRRAAIEQHGNIYLNSGFFDF